MSSNPHPVSQPAGEASAREMYTLLAAFADELGRCGLREACTSPGSRCAPLVLTFARDPRLRCHSHVDERCAGFFALGLAKASGLPVAVACTSGTAVAELLPAVVEAYEARVPMIVLSADRPPELRENGAGQSIDQIKLFGDYAKWFFEVGSHEATPERVRWMRGLACRAFWTAIEGRPGVVHLNFPLREPLVCDPPPTAPAGGRPGGAPLTARRPPVADAAADAHALDELIADRRRGIVIAGRHERLTPLGHAAAAFCTASGWPLLADPMSGARRGVAAIAHYDALLREQSFLEAHRPEAIVRIGDLPVSKPLRTWLADLTDVPQIALDPEGAWQDPATALSHSLAADPAATLNALSSKPRAADPSWLAGWRSADERAAEAILRVLDGRDGNVLSEPALALELGVLLPDAATLFVASSMPVRDIETFWPVRADPPRVLCNRGANGIDGTISSAFGTAAAEDGPVVLLIGDVAFAHDIGGLLAASRLDLKLTIVLVSNGGGGIFDFLPVSSTPMALERDLYTEHIATPTGLDFANAAALYGLTHECADSLPALRAALERALSQAQSAIVEVPTAGDRTENVHLHRRVWSAVSAALTS
jgi:2-succinyl-5-enolpyruvyl-6-hydroxy-3-cyclohexene-1-carboxylate synthase